MTTLRVPTLVLVGTSARPASILLTSREPGEGLHVDPAIVQSEGAMRELRVRLRSVLPRLVSETEADKALDVHVTSEDAPLGATLTSAHDATIALGILALRGHVDAGKLRETFVVGELSLVGDLRSPRGVVPLVRTAADRDQGTETLDLFWRVVVPAGAVREASLAIELAGRVGTMRESQARACAADLRSIVDYLNGDGSLPKIPAYAPALPSTIPFDMSDLAVFGADAPRLARAMTIAAAGGHTMLLVGPPGCGTTMLARRLATMLPPTDDTLEERVVASVAGLTPTELETAPFRAPHHTVSAAGLLGGGHPVRPGEVSLAHGGVLLLDEVVEFRRDALEGLWHAIDRREVSIHRAKTEAIAFPANPLVVGAAPPCIAGCMTTETCTCSTDSIKRYQARVGMTKSAPRPWDLIVAVPPLPSRTLACSDEREVGPGAKLPSSAELRRTIEASRKFAAECGRDWNARALGALCTPEEHAERVARTIADLDGSPVVRENHRIEAAVYSA